MRALARRAMKVAAAAADRPRGHRQGIVILLYHRVGSGTGGEMELDPKMFEDQMAAVAPRAVTLDAAVDALSGGPRPGPDPVVVTFDDGTADVVDVALPILEHHRVPALLYVATEFIDRGVRFPGDGEPASWDALRDAAASGWLDLGSHTHTHALLDRLPGSATAAELDRSMALLAENTGVVPKHFAYPKALLGSPVAEAAVRERFRTAALAGTRPNRYGVTDPYRLARSPIQRSDGWTYFERKVAGGMGFEDWLRGIANRRRYADAVT